MKNRNKLVLVLIITLNLIYCGKLVDVKEENITLEQTEGKGKKLTTKNTDIDFSAIKETVVQIKF